MRSARLASLLVMLLTACGQTGEEDAREPSAASGGTLTTTSASRVRTYASLAELRADSAAVLVARATDARRIGTLDAPPGVSTLAYTVTTLDVERVLWGRAEPTLLLYQIGGPGKRGFSSPVVEPGKRYLLYVVAYDRPGEVDRWFAVTGDTGIYELRGEEYVRVSTAEGDTIPERIPATTADSVVRA